MYLPPTEINRLADRIPALGFQLARDTTREQVAALLEQGVKQSKIAKELKLTKGRVSQLAKEAKAEESDS
jgi:hypothetical protein